MDKNKLISTFSGYVQTYDLNNQVIAQKFQHSLNVANYALDIANFLLLDNNLKQCVFIVGLLHEYGSFESLKQNNPNLRDKHLFEQLFKENKILNYTQNKSQISLIKKTLQLFYKKTKMQNEDISSFLINPKTQKQKALCLLYILKDSDTLELFGMLKRKVMPQPFNAVKFEKNTFSKKVLADFKAKNKVSVLDVSSNLDKILLFVSLFFELNYLISKNIALKLNFEQAIMDCYISELSTEEITKIERVLKTFKNKYYEN